MVRSFLSSGTFLVIYLLLLTHHAWADNRYLSYQGRILDLHGSPLEHHAVQFKFEITDPSGTCVIYRETSAAKDMRNSLGVFDVTIGSGSVDALVPGDVTIETVFKNGRIFNCLSGGTFSAFGNANRKLRVSFLDAVGWRLITPDQEIHSVPFASYALTSASAQKIGNLAINESAASNGKVLKFQNGQLVFADDDQGLATINGSNITSGTISGSTSIDTTGSIQTSGTYRALQGTNYVEFAAPDTISSSYTLKLPPGPGTNGQVLKVNGLGQMYWDFDSIGSATGSASGDLSGTYPAPTVARLQGQEVSATPPLASQVLMYSGGRWAPGNLGIADLKTDLGAPQFANSSCSASQTLTWSSLTDTFSCSNIAGLSASSISSGVLAENILPSIAKLWNEVGDGRIFYSGGQIGIGVNAPSSLLHLREPDDSWNSSLRMDRSWDSDTDYVQILYDFEGLKIRTLDNGDDKADIIFKPLDSESVRLTQDGKVGLQNPIPTATFEVGTSLTSSLTSLNNRVFKTNDVQEETSGSISSNNLITQIKPDSSSTAFNHALVVELSNPVENNSNLQNVASGRFLSTNNSSATISAGQYSLIASARNVSGGSISYQYGASTNAQNSSTGTAQNQQGIYATSVNSGGGLISNQYGGRFEATNSSGTTNNQYGSRSIAKSAGSATTSNQFGAVATSLNSGSGTIASSVGLFGSAVAEGSGIITNATGVSAQVYSTSDQQVSNAYAVFAETLNSGTGSMQNAYGVYTAVSAPQGLVTNGYGIYIGSIASTNKWTLYSADSSSKSYIAGSVGIGTTSPEEMLHIAGNIKANSTVYTSDRRYKRNIQSIDQALEKILSLRGVTYDWRREEFPDLHFPERHQMGLIAQDVEIQFPEAVNTDSKGYKSVNYPSLLAPLIEAVKELYQTLRSLGEQQKLQSQHLASLEKEMGGKVEKEEIERPQQENSRKERELQELKRRLDRLEKLAIPHQR